MTDKFKDFLSRSQAELLSTRDLACLVNASPHLKRLFQPLLKERQFFHHVERDERTKVRDMLAQTLDFFSKKVKIIRVSGRIFTELSPQDYMLWALGKDEFHAMLSCMPQSEQGREVSTRLSAQYKAHHQLLHHVVGSEHDAVRDLLREDIDALLREGSVIDCSGRFFANITPFRYALWALDGHMWDTILSSIPKNEKGHEVFLQLRAQYDALSEGVTYQLNGVPITESHFNFEQTIIKELQTQVDFHNASAKNWEAADRQWRKGVGGVQGLLPMHVVNAYCTELLFQPIPDFTTYPGPSRRYLDRKAFKYTDWFQPGSGLGSEFAMCKGAGQDGIVWVRKTTWAGTAPIQVDLAAMKALYAARTRDFARLALQLPERTTADRLSSAV